MFTFAIHNNKNKKTTIMKKSIALVAMAFGVTSAFAQDLTSKKGEPFLPEAGDYAIAIDAKPFLDYAGNFFGKANPNVAPSWNFATNNMTIWGKMFKDANTAYRAGIRLGFGSETNRNMTAQRYTAAATPTTVTFPTASAQVENVYKASQTNIGITAGIEKRRGKTRLQGFYGAEVGISISSSKDKFTYGNALVADDASGAGIGVTGADDMFDSNGNPANNVSVGNPGIDGLQGNARITERKNGMNFGLGIRGFVGAEYFVAPKVSIGGEFGWGLGLNMYGKSKTTWEGRGTSTGATAQTVGTATIEGAKSGSFGIDTDNMTGVFGAKPAGTIRLALHF